jgi:hypothetical protein
MYRLSPPIRQSNQDFHFEPLLADSTPSRRPFGAVIKYSIVAVLCLFKIAHLGK